LGKGKREDTLWQKRENGEPTSNGKWGGGGGHDARRGLASGGNHGQKVPWGKRSESLRKRKQPNPFRGGWVSFALGNQGRGGGGKGKKRNVKRGG